MKNEKVEKKKIFTWFEVKTSKKYVKNNNEGSGVVSKGDEIARDKYCMQGAQKQQAANKSLNF